MKALSLLLVILVASLFVMAAEMQDAGNLYFGQTPPGDTPEVFAPGIISLDDRFEQFLLYSPDSRGLVFGVTDSSWGSFTLESLQLRDEKWTEPETAAFLGSNPEGIVSCLSYDMRRAFFTTSRPAYPPVNIWMNERGENGWSEPVFLGPPISSDGNEFEISIAQNGTLYFSSVRNSGHGDMDIYRAPLVDGEYSSIENLGPPINSASGDDLPYIAPDESYLLFASSREGSLGQRDLYISFQVNGEWTQPVNLGSEINTEGFDIYPSVSPDGKYLFFTRRHAWMATEDSDIYWVSTGVIDRLRKVALSQ
ncbi:MAG: hypothetical protein GY906_01705 [bacterium]|nr:hypothetical protein [bacterium]